MAKLETKDYSYILVASFLTFILVLLISWFGIKPLWENNKKLSEGARIKKEELNYLEFKEKKLKELEDKKEELEEQKEKALSALPQDKDEPRIFTQISEMAKSSGSSVSSVSISENTSGNTGDTSEQPSVSQDIKEVPLGISFKGNYSSFKSFLEKAESALRILSIDSMDISGDSNSLSVSFEGRTFFKVLGGQE